MQAWMEDAEQMELHLPPIPVGLSEAARMTLEGLSALIRDCTHLDPKRRPSFRQICQRIRELPPRSEHDKSGFKGEGSKSNSGYASDLSAVI